MVMRQTLTLFDSSSVDKIWEAYYKVKDFLFKKPKLDEIDRFGYFSFTTEDDREIKFSDIGTIKNPENLKMMLNNVELVLNTQKLKRYYFSADIKIEK